MNPIVQLYWIRVALAIVAAALSAVLAIVTGTSTDTYTPLINGIAVALAVYLGSYYILRPKFGKIIEPQSKIMMTGIGIYFFAWLTFFVLFYTLAKPF